MPRDVSRQPFVVTLKLGLPFPFFLDAFSPSERKTGGHALFYGKPSIPPLSSSTFEEQARDTVASDIFTYVIFHPMSFTVKVLPHFCCARCKKSRGHVAYLADVAASWHMRACAEEDGGSLGEGEMGMGREGKEREGKKEKKRKEKDGVCYRCRYVLHD